MFFSLHFIFLLVPVTLRESAPLNLCMLSLVTHGLFAGSFHIAIGKRRNVEACVPFGDA